MVHKGRYVFQNYRAYAWILEVGGETHIELCSVLQGSDPHKSHLSPPFGRNSQWGSTRRVKALKVTQEWGDGGAKRRAIRIKAPKNKGREGSKVMSMDHTVKCSKLQHGRQEAYRYHQGGNCDHQGKCFTEVMRTNARFSPDGEEKKQRHSAPPTLRRNDFFSNRGRNFPGGPVVRCLPCSARDVSLIPGPGTGIPPAHRETKSLCATARESLHCKSERSHMTPQRSHVP